MQSINLEKIMECLQRTFGLEDEIDIIKRDYPETLLYEKYKSKYKNKVKLMKDDKGYYIQQIRESGEEKPSDSTHLWILGDTISKENFAKYKYVKYCIERFETEKPTPIEV